MGATDSVDPRSRDLLDRGFRDLEKRFDSVVGLVRSPFLPEKHQPHPTIWYALCALLRKSEGDSALVEEIISRALDLQELREDDPHYGNFRWFHEDEAVTDLNACQFIVEALVHLLLRAGDRLSDQAKERIFGAIKLALCEAERLDVHWSYTNIHLLDALNNILGGQLLGDEQIRGRGETRLAQWAQRTKEAGAPHEFNSPTYAAVQINALAAIARFAQHKATSELALEMEQFIWRHVVRYWHAPTMQLGGPHSRAYRRDVTGASGFLKVVLYKLLGDPRLLASTPYYSGPDTEGEVHVALTEYHCPEDAARMFRDVETRDVSEHVGPDMTLAARITPEFALGTMSRQYGVGEPPEPWPMHNSCILYYSKPTPPGYGVVYCRYRINAGPVGTPSRTAAPPWLDIWEDGVFRTTQEGGRALVAYGLSPRGQRPTESLRLDIRLHGALDGGDLSIAGAPLNGEPLPIDSGEALAVADGNTYLGIKPIAPSKLGHGPTCVVWQDGDELVVSIINYEGPPKVFWEFRSLSGPFFKGNVKNGFVLWVAARSQFRSLEDFYETLASLHLTDRTLGSVRRIECGVSPEQLVLEYDLLELKP
jgi:hypothetical protein